MSRPTPAPLVDLLKVVASQLIVWHHLAFYGPMSDVVHPHAPGLIDWLYDQARLAVQVFLVVGGFLAARSLLPRLGEPPRDLGWRGAGRLIWRRYVRLALPLVFALAAAVAAAAVARTLIDNPSIPDAPTLLQLAANLALLHDWFGQDALTAGLWYVAIDLHLYVLWVGVVALRAPLARRGLHPGSFALLAGGGLMVASMFVFNRDPELDAYAPYFFGAYGLGVFAQWISTRPRHEGWPLLLAAVVLAALAVEWRDRLLVAGLTALALAWWADGARLRRWARRPAVAALSRHSYAVFLMHYPVMLAVGALVGELWPDSALANGLGMASAWALALLAGAVLHRLIEAPQTGPRPLQVSASTP